MSSDWLPQWAIERYGRYGAITLPWHRMGVNTLPMSAKRPLVPFSYKGSGYDPGPDGFAPPEGGWHKADSPKLAEEIRMRWTRRYRDTNAGLLPGRTSLLFFDIDDRVLVEPFIEASGLSRYWITHTRRGAHVVCRWEGDDLGMGAKTYRVPGVDSCDIDHRCSGGYVIAPGSIHPSGAEYTFGLPYEQLLELSMRGEAAFDELDVLDPGVEQALRAPRPERHPRDEGRERVSVGGGRSGQGSFTPGGTVPPSTIVEAENGRKYRLGQIPEGLGFFAWDREDKNPSMRATVHHGRRYVHDWGARRMWWEVVEPVRSDFLDDLVETIESDQSVDPREPQLLNNNSSPRGPANEKPAAEDAPLPYAEDAPPPIDLSVNQTDYVWRRHPRVDTVEVTDRYLKDALVAQETAAPARMIVASGPPGTGKSEAMRWLVEHHGGQAGLICSRRANTRQLASRTGLGLYSDPDVARKIAEGVVSGVATTIHSLSSVMESLALKPGDLDVLLLDEVMKVMEELTRQHGIVRDQKREFDTLRMLVRAAKLVVIADADMRQSVVELFMSWLPEGSVVRHYYHPHKQKERPVLTSFDDGMLRLEALMAHAAQDPEFKVAVACSSCRMAEDVAARFEALHRNVKSLSITGKNSDEPDRQSYLENPDTIFDDHQVLFYTPAIDSGVSITTPVDAVITFADNPDISAEAVMQMAMRCRTAGRRIIAARKQKPRKGVPVATQLHAQAYMGAKLDFEQQRKALGSVISPTHMRGYVITDPVFEHAWWNMQGIAWSLRKDPNKDLREILDERFEGFEDALDVELEPDAEQDAKDQRRRAKAVGDVVRDKRYEAISKADEISKDEAERIDKAHVREVEEKHKLAKHRIAAFYDRDVTPELVKRDNDGKLRPKLKALAMTSLILQGKREQAAAVAYNRNHGKPSPKQQARFAEAMLRAALISEVFGASNLESFDDVTDKEYDADELRLRIMQFVESYRGALETYRFFGAIPQDGDHAVRWLGGIMRKMGITRHKDPNAQSGSRGRVYTWDVAEALDLSAPERRRMEGANYEKARKALSNIDFDALISKYMEAA